MKCETPIQTWFFWLRWGVNQVSRIPGSRDIGFNPLFGPFYPILTHFGHFRALPVIWEVHNVWNANRNMHFLSEMRGQTTFYDERFRIYRILAVFHGISGGNNRNIVCATSFFRKFQKNHIFPSFYDISQLFSFRPKDFEKKRLIVPTLINQRYSRGPWRYSGDHFGTPRIPPG